MFKYSRTFGCISHSLWTEKRVSYYDILELNEKASSSEIRQSFLQKGISVLTSKLGSSIQIKMIILMHRRNSSK
jgi:hypothetical protein